MHNKCCDDYKTRTFNLVKRINSSKISRVIYRELVNLFENFKLIVIQAQHN